MCKPLLLALMQGDCLSVPASTKAGLQVSTCRLGEGETERPRSARQQRRLCILPCQPYQSPTTPRNTKIPPRPTKARRAKKGGFVPPWLSILWSLVGCHVSSLHRLSGIAME